MQVETFKVFCDLAQTTSFSKAAILNSITQSAVSQQIRALEDQFKVVLIERGRRNFSLTQEGMAFLGASIQILRIYDSLNDRMHDLQNIVAGELKIASIYSIGLHELPSYLKEFRRRYPGVTANVRYRRSAEVYADVLNEDVEIGMVAFPRKRKGLAIKAFWRDKLVMICHPSHPLARRKRVRLEELNGEKFISFSPDAPTRKAIDQFLSEHQVKVDRVQELDNVETVKRSVEIESGISIVPLRTVDNECRAVSLVAVEIDAPRMWRPLGAIIKRSRVASPAQKHFLALLQKNSAREAELVNANDA